MQLSVIVPCFNAADTIATQLEALANQQFSKPWEIIISDNGSTDQTLAVVERYRHKLPSLRIVDASAKRGAAYARNAGVQAATGDALAFCDADDEVASGWVEAIARALSEHDFVCSRFEGEKLNGPSAFQTHRCPQQDGVQEYKYPPFLPHAGGCGLGIKRTLHEAVGGFDETMSCLEDTDYCWRVQLAGAKLCFVPDAIIHIRYRDGLGSMYRQGRRWGEGNVWVYKKFRRFGMPELSWKLGVRAWWELLLSFWHVHSKNDFCRWLWHFGWRMGRLQGSIEYRVFAL
jgi:glycosyltransferase involved in cell wall biosynthesis